MNRSTVEIFCKIAKKICQAKTFADHETKNILDETLEIMAKHCSCPVESLLRNKIDEILNANDKA